MAPDPTRSLLPPETDARVPYHRLLRAAGGPGGPAARGLTALTGVLVVLAGFWAAGPLVVAALVRAWLSLTGQDVADGLARLTDTASVTPGVLAYVTSAIALGLLVVRGVVRLLDRVPPGWLASVAGRLRWRWVLLFAGPALGALLASLVLAAVLPTSVVSGAGAGEGSTGLNPVTAATWQFLLVIVVLVPLQAAAEEYVFRGYLTQAFGGLLSDPRLATGVAVVVPAVVFALLHGAQSPAVFIDRLAFGLLAGVLVVATGGLEAALAYHVVNNVLAFGLALLVGDISTVLQPSGGNGWDVVVSVVRSLLYLVAVVWIARRAGLATTADRAELEASAARV